MKSFNKLAVLCAVLALSSSAFATSLAPGGSVVPTSLSVTGVTEISTTISGTITTGTFSASYLTGVFTDTNNVYCSGCLDFIYQFENNGPDTLERATMTNFDSFLTNVGYSAAAGGTAVPTTVTRNSFGDIAFNFAGVASGVESELLIIQTNATSYGSGFFSLQDGTAGSGAAYAPATPEPSSLMLMGSGLVSAAGMFLRRRRVNA